MKRYAKTQNEAARELKTTPRTFQDWTQRDGFPKKTKKGWDLVAIDAWCKLNLVGKYRRQAVEITGDTLTTARIRHLKAQTAREELARQTEQIEFDAMLGKILMAEDVEGLMQRTTATAGMLLTAIVDRVDRAAPERCPTAETWPAIRRRLLAEVTAGSQDVSSALESLVLGGDEQVQDVDKGD